MAAEGGESKPGDANAGGFKPTKEQLAGLKIVSVGKSAFRDEQVTDGKIALNADRTTPVYSPYSGRVTKVLVGLGETVHQGQPLLAIQASEFVQGQSDLLTAQAGLAAAKAQRNNAEAIEKRKHAMFDIKAGSLQDWQQSQADLAVAQGQERSAEAAYKAVRNRLLILGKSESDIDALAQGERQDPVAYVLAPIAGTVTDRQVGPGQYIQAGASNPVYTIADVNKVWLIANVRETEAPSVRRGQLLEVHVVAVPDQVFTGRVSFVSPVLDPNTRRLTVRAELDNPKGLLKPEMFASFHVVAGSAEQAVSVPLSGVVYEGSDAHVWILGDDGVMRLRPIKPGRSSGTSLEVLDGVKVGEKVVASGALFIDRAATGD